MLDKPNYLTNYEKPLVAEPEASFTLPSYLYTDPQVYEIEKERIFYRTWQFIAHKSSFGKPGDYVTARICDQNIFVMMGGDGELRAFYNVCQHRAHELLPEGSGNVRRVIVCPYHAWTFEREGALRGAPRSEKRPGFNKADYSLKQIRLEMFLDCAFINMDDDAVSLAEIAGDLERDVREKIPFFGELKHPRRSEFGQSHIKAGWKVVVDNYVECYHCDHAHPDFADLICMDTYQHDTFDQWARQLGTDIKNDNSAYALTGDEPYLQSAFWFLWPNTTINILPGTQELNIACIRPLGLEDSDFGGVTLSTTTDFNKARDKYTAEILVPEDIDLCESVQRGLRSKGYSQGPMIVDPERSGRGEHAIHHFHRLVQKSLS
ncbi:MAG: aromatic ring-hydroxylating dioxygenase subunit alpha [Rhizobiaceae bacterium]|nr:aromatic ring-hydroxylating dioxygenase subunit alpha [Rhizobiaceae bacterium]